jgi:hypothetical protein
MVHPLAVQSYIRVITLPHTRLERRLHLWCNTDHKQQYHTALPVWLIMTDPCGTNNYILLNTFSVIISDCPPESGPRCTAKVNKITFLLYVVYSNLTYQLFPFIYNCTQKMMSQLPALLTAPSWVLLKFGYARQLANSWRNYDWYCLCPPETVSFTYTFRVLYKM